MGRSAVTTRVGQLSDVETLVRLASRGRAEVANSGAGNEAGAVSVAPPRGTRAHELAALMRNPAARVVVAEVGGTIVGFAAFHLRRPAGDQAPVVELGTMYVRPAHRRRGAGHALIADAAEFATAVGAERIACGPIPTTRAFHRFLVCLGFAGTPDEPARRTAVPSVVRRRLLAAESRGDEVVARRVREVRIRAACADVDGRNECRTGELPFVATQANRSRQAGPAEGGVEPDVKSRHVMRALATGRPS